MDVVAAGENRSDGQNYPQNRIVQNSTFFSGTGIKQLSMSSSILIPGLYWLAVLNTSGNNNFFGYVRGDCQSAGWQRDGTTTGSMRPITGYAMGHFSSSLPIVPDDDMQTLDEIIPNQDTPSIWARFVPTP